MVRVVGFGTFLRVQEFGGLGRRVERSRVWGGPHRRTSCASCLPAPPPAPQRQLVSIDPKTHGDGDHLRWRPGDLCEAQS